jgi:hypothetical protein
MINVLFEFRVIVIHAELVETELFFKIGDTGLSFFKKSFIFIQIIFIELRMVNRFKVLVSR